MKLFAVLVVCAAAASSIVVQRLDPTGGDVGVFSSVALVGGVPAVAYTRLVSSDGQSELRYLRCEQAECTSATIAVLASGLSQGYHPSLAVRPNGLPFVSFSQSSASGGASVSVALCSDVACSVFSANSSLLPSAASSPGWTSAAMVGSVPMVMFVANLDTVSALYLWQGSASKLIFSQPLPDLFQWGSDRNMAVVNSAPFTALYADGVGLILIVCAESTCIPSLVQHPVVDVWVFATDVGLYPSVAVSPSTGLAVVAYHDASNLQLKMVLCQNTFCTTRLVRSFPSTYGWDPSVIFDVRSNLPLVAFGDPSKKDVILMSCGTATCSNASFVALTAGQLPVRQFETVRMLSSLPFVFAHDTLSSSLVAVYLGNPITGCAGGACAVTVVITSPSVSPFATAESLVTVAGFVTGGQNLTIVVNNSTQLAFTPETGQFTGIVPLSPGTLILTVAAVDQLTQQEVGEATVLVVSDALGPKLNIISPGNGSSTVAASIAVQGTASALTGVASVVLTNSGIPGSAVATNSTSPIWSAVVPLVSSATNVILVTATDNVGTSVSQVLVIVQSGLNPLLTCPSDFTIECGTQVPNPALRVENCVSPIVEAPQSSVAACGGTQTLRKTFTACSSSCSYTITFVDTTPPFVTCPPDVTVACDAVASLGPAQASDACTPTPALTVSESHAPVCGSNFTRLFRASDGCGNSATCTQTVVVLLPVSNLPTATPTPGLSSGEIGGLIAGVVLLLVLLLVCFIIALLWLRRRQREQEQFKEPIMMADWDEELSSSTSTITRSKLYKPPANQSDDSADFREIMQ